MIDADLGSKTLPDEEISKISQECFEEYVKLAETATQRVGNLYGIPIVSLDEQKVGQRLESLCDKYLLTTHQRMVLAFKLPTFIYAYMFGIPPNDFLPFLANIRMSIAQSLAKEQMQKGNE